MAIVISIVKGFLARLLYFVHGFVCVWRLTDVHENPVYWVVIIPIALLPIEFVWTMKYTKEKGEWKWVCPSIFLYLCCTIPAVYMLEVELLEERIKYREENNLKTCDFENSELHTNSSGLSDLQGVTVPVELTDDFWTLALEQLWLCFLIIGRWFLPKGGLTREQLSTLLLVYIAMASDILEFSTEALSEPVVRCNRLLVHLILVIASLSMLQFALVLTATSDKQQGNTAGRRKCCHVKYPTEVRGILITSLMQDGPFLAMRLYLMIHFRAINQTMLFFTCKNVLMLMLQGYRLIIMCCPAEATTTVIKVAPAEDGELQITEVEEVNENYRTKLTAPRV